VEHDAVQEEEEKVQEENTHTLQVTWLHLRISLSGQWSAFTH
jgi:hypothetical protein